METRPLRLLVCRSCNVAGSTILKDGIPVEVECVLCRGRVTGAERVREMILDEARRLGISQAHDVPHSAFDNVPGIRPSPGEALPEPDWPFVAGG